MKLLKKLLDALKKIFFSEDVSTEVAEKKPRQSYEIPDELDSPEGWK